MRDPRPPCDLASAGPDPVQSVKGSQNANVAGAAKRIVKRRIQSHGI